MFTEIRIVRDGAGKGLLGWGRGAWVSTQRSGGGSDTFQLQQLTLSIKADGLSVHKLRSVEQACSLVAQPVFLTVQGGEG